MRTAPLSPSMHTDTDTDTDTSTGGSTGSDDDGDGGSPCTPPDNDNADHDYNHAFFLQPFQLVDSDASAAIGSGSMNAGWSDASLAITTNADAQLEDAGVHLPDAHKVEGREPEVMTGGPSPSPSLSLSLSLSLGPTATLLRLEGNHWM